MKIKYFLILIFILFNVHIFAERVRSRNSFSIYKNSNLIGYVIEINDWVKDEALTICLFKDNYKKYIILKIKNLMKDMEKRKEFWQRQEKIEKIENKKVRDEEEAKLKKEYNEFADKIEPWEMSIYEESKSKTYYLFSEGLNLCMIYEEKKFCEDEMIDFISGAFSSDIKSILHLWNCYEYFTTFILLTPPLECIVNNYVIKEEFIDCKDAEGKISGINCDIWENAKTIDNVQVIIKEDEK